MEDEENPEKQEEIVEIIGDDEENELIGVENYQAIQIRSESEELRVQRLYYLVTKKTAIGIWQPLLRLVEVTKIKGNFWKKVGFSIQSRNYLYPEEALYLFEKRQIALCQSNEKAESQIFMTKEEIFGLFYEEHGLDLGIFLAYSKFKSLGYIPFRRKPIGRVFQDEANLTGKLALLASICASFLLPSLALLARNPFRSLLDLTVIYEVYRECENFSKSAAKQTPPIAYALLTDGDHMFSYSLLAEILQEANGIPLIIAIISPNGIVSLVEFADAERALDLYNTTKTDTGHMVP